MPEEPTVTPALPSGMTGRLFASVPSPGCHALLRTKQSPVHALWCRFTALAISSLQATGPGGRMPSHHARLSHAEAGGAAAGAQQLSAPSSNQAQLRQRNEMWMRKSDGHRNPLQVRVPCSFCTLHSSLSVVQPLGGLRNNSAFPSHAPQR